MAAPLALIQVVEVQILSPGPFVRREMIQAQILADSIAPSGTRLTTMRVTMPRFILAEFNTHRVFSRNAGSSRAISVKRRMEMIRTNPVIPVEWGIEQRGMQASQVIEDATKLHDVESLWRHTAVEIAEIAGIFEDHGIHKQIVNRLLEPFSWVTVIVSSTLWDNFFNLRCSPMAQPEMRVTAEKMQEQYQLNAPIEKQWDEWHIPTLKLGEREQMECLDDAILGACGRIARVSYEANSKTLAEELDLAKSLMTNGHWSPFEHVAQCVYGKAENCRNFVRDWAQYRALVGG